LQLFYHIFTVKVDFGLKPCRQEGGMYLLYKEMQISCFSYWLS